MKKQVLEGDIVHGDFHPNMPLFVATAAALGVLWWQRAMVFAWYASFVATERLRERSGPPAMTADQIVIIVIRKMASVLLLVPPESREQAIVAMAAIGQDTAQKPKRTKARRSTTAKLATSRQKKGRSKS